MIKTISIQGYKSFPNDRPVVITFDTSKRVAMLYGVNGAGKSAIGQVIYRNGNNIEPVAHCSIALTRDEPYQYLVYNDDFVEQTFRNRSDMPGIFTIGRPEATALKRAEELENDIGAWRDRQEVLTALRTEREAEKTRAHTAVLDGVWPAYTEHKSGALKEWVSGLGNAKQKVFDTLDAVVLTDDEVPPTIADLTLRMADVGDAGATAKQKVSIVMSGFDSLEQNALWGKSIAGSGDSRLAPLIEELGNMDWVSEGRAHLEHSKGKCPFCQEGLPHDFADQLTRLFDASYERDVAEVKRLTEDYGQKIDALDVAMKTVLDDEPFAKEHADIERVWTNLHLRLSKNLGLMQKKVQSPREAVSIPPSTEDVGSVSTAVGEVNDRIATFNARIADRGNERTRIKRDFWKRMRYDHRGTLSVYTAAKKSTEDAIKTIDVELTDLHGKVRDGDAELVQLRASTSGTDQAVDAINGRLLSLGIEAFKIKKQDGNSNLYHLERGGVGANDYRSLSEGEKTLITFLYFVERIGASASADFNAPFNRKIVVIDDPISSLSHNYVYDIASIIVHDVIGRKDEDGKEFKQVIVLTHSLFFHHELIQAHGKPKQIEFKRVLKHAHSEVLPMEKDDLLNDYEAFWQVIRDAKVGRAGRATIANAMRCIFERFFYFTRRQDDFKDALRKISSNEHAFTPLARYLDRQSHADAINRTDFGDYDVDYYLAKFEAVFKETDQMAHYNAMLGVEAPDADVPDAGAVV
jgi:wobble nucleotide-excising tRNase